MRSRFAQVDYAAISHGIGCVRISHRANLHELAVLLLEGSCQVGAPNHNRLYPGGGAPLHLVVTRLNLTTPAGVRQLVELHGGTISVESRENTGSTFIMRLPLVAGTEPVVTEAPDGPPGRAAATA